MGRERKEGGGEGRRVAMRGWVGDGEGRRGKGSRERRRAEGR